jgi:hypothetical protein
MQKELISNSEWLPFVLPTLAQVRWLMCLDNDALSAQLSFYDYVDAGRSIAKTDQAQLAAANSRVVHYAKCFVCAVRRFARVLEHSGARTFPAAVARAIKTQRRAKASFFQGFVDPRDGIEHLAEEVASPAKTISTDEILLNPTSKTWHPVFADVELRPGELVVGSCGAELSWAALDSVLSARQEIVSAVLLYLPKRAPTDFYGVFPVPFKEL